MTGVPAECTLPTDEQPLRVAEFDDLFATAVAPADRRSPTWLRLHLAGTPEVAATARDLIDRESACCTFFAFELVPSGGTTVLDVRVPDAHAPVLDAVQARADAAIRQAPAAPRTP